MTAALLIAAACNVWLLVLLHDADRRTGRANAGWKRALDGWDRAIDELIAVRKILDEAMTELRQARREQREKPT